MQPGASGDAWYWVVVQTRSPGTSRPAAGLGCKRKGVRLRHSSPQSFRFLGFVCAQPTCAGVGMRVLGTARAQGSWVCVLLEMFVAQGEHPLHHESVRNVPGCHCSQMTAGSLRSLPRQEGADPAGPSTLLLPPYIPRAAQRHRSRDRVQQPSLCTGRGLGASHKPLCPSALAKSCPLWGYSAASEQAL